MSYTSAAEARSDLILAGAVYLFGPIVWDVLFGIVPLGRLPVLGTALFLLRPLVITILVPILLMRYRRESLREFGFGRGGVAALLLGVAAAVPLALASLVSPLLDGRMGPVALTGDRSAALAVAYQLLSWLALAGLAVYGTVKARDAFGGDPRSVRIGAHEIGRVVALVALVATLLLVAAFFVRGGGLLVDLPLFPLAAVGTVSLAVLSLRGPSSTTRAVLLTPLVLLALRPFTLTLDAVGFVYGVWLATVLGAVGLAIGVLQESRRSAYPAIGLALVLALLTGL